MAVYLLSILGDMLLIEPLPQYPVGRLPVCLFFQISEFKNQTLMTTGLS